MRSPLEQIQFLQQEVLGEELQTCQDPQAVLERLQQGQEVDLVLDWDGRPQTVVLRALQGQRVLFYNPQGHFPGFPVGTALEDDGPPRQIEGHNLESVLLQEFLDWFAEGRAQALVPV